MTLSCSSLRYMEAYHIHKLAAYNYDVREGDAVKEIVEGEILCFVLFFVCVSAVISHSRFYNSCMLTH